MLYFYSNVLSPQTISSSGYAEAAAPAHVVGFEAATVRSYPVRLVSLAAKLCRRSYHVVWAKMQSVQVCCEYSLWELSDIYKNMLVHLLAQSWMKK